MLTRAYGAAPRLPRRDRGFSLVEVLVTLLIVGVGLLGLAGLQARALIAESEAHSRGQALTLLQDIAERIEANQTDAKAALSSALSISNLGCGYTASTGSRLNTDLNEWDATLRASTALPKVCGCVQAISASSEFVLSVAWRGRDTGFAPSAAQSCGSANIATARRVVSSRIRIPNLGG